MQVDNNTTLHVHTPGGLMVEYHEADWPKTMKDMLQLNTPDAQEAAVAYLSRLTNCRCSIKTTVQATCEANDLTFPKRSK